MNQDANIAETVFLAALDKSTRQEQVAYLESACAGIPGLLDRVHELLSSHEELNGPLDFPPHVIMSRTPAIQEQIGAVIGPYKLLEQIGEGGMGVVYMAEQSQPMKRKVALKIIKPGMDTKQVVARFEAERQALALMDHPNIAKVLDGGSTDNAGASPHESNSATPCELPAAGRPYFVMELVRGIPITDYCDKNKLTTTARLELFVKVCQAVQHAHQKGIIHRDIKPGNVLVTLHDGVPVPKVIDFGVAKAINQKLTERTLFTNFAQMVGTPLYMSPEQAELSGLDVDTRSDIYSLGVLLYELLTGSTPFDRETLKQAGYDEFRRILREDEPPRPSARLSTLEAVTLTAVSACRDSDPRKLGQQVRGELDWIVLRAMEKDRTRRYESASGLVADIERFLADEPVLACPPSAPYRLRKFVRRNKTLFTFGSLVVGFLLLSTIGLTISTALISQGRTEALRQQGIATEQRDVARENEQKVLEREGTIREFLYAADIRLASEAYQNGHIAAAQERLERHRPQAGMTDDRDFAWHYLWDLCQDNSTSIQHHQQAVFHVAYSPDGTLMASASDDQSVVVWNVAEDVPCCELRDFTADVNGVAFSADGTLLATAEEQRMVRVWEVKTGKEMVRLTGFKQPVARVFFTADQKTLVATEVNWETNAGRISLWDLEIGECLKAVDGYRALAVHQETNLLAACDVACNFSLWSLPELVQKSYWQGHGDHVLCAAFAADGQYLVSGCRQGVVKLWHLADLSGRHMPHRRSGYVRGLAFSPDGQFVVSVGDSGTARIWDAKSGSLQRVLRAGNGRLWTAAVSPDGATLVVGCESGSLCSWDLDQLPLARRRIVDLPTGPVDAVLDSRSQRVAVVTNESGEVSVFDTEDSVGIVTIVEPDGVSVSRLRFSPDDRFLWMGNYVGQVRQADVRNGTFLKTIKQHDDMVLAMRIAPDGTCLATSTLQTCKVWDIRSGRIMSILKTDPDRPFGHYAPNAFLDNRTMLVTSNRSAFELDLETGEKGPLQFQENAYVHAVAVSPDGQTIATGTEAGEVHLWDVKQNQKQVSLSGHFGKILNLAFSPDARILASASDRQEIKLWHLPTKQLLLDLKGLRGPIPLLEFSHDGRRLIGGGQSADTHGEVIAWGVSPNETQDGRQVLQNRTQE